LGESKQAKNAKDDRKAEKRMAHIYLGRRWQQKVMST
jgi:hypothetical protein